MSCWRSPESLGYLWLHWSLGRHENATSRKNFSIKKFSITKPRNYSERTFCMNISFQLVLYIMKVKSQEDQYFEVWRHVKPPISFVMLWQVVTSVSKR